MKKITALLLVVIMALSMAACGASGSNETTGSKVVVPASAEEILTNVWNLYGDAEKFPIIGGNMEAMIMDTPAAWDMTYAENLTYNLLVPADKLANVDAAASMIHMMNANTFTCGTLHLTAGTDAKAFAQTMRDAVMNNQWMCGFPEKLIVAVVGGEYILVSFGVNDAMNPFQTHFATAYPAAEILFNEAIA